MKRGRGKRCALLCAGAIAMACGSVRGAGGLPAYWSGQAGTLDWGDAANWQSSRMPGPTDEVMIYTRQVGGSNSASPIVLGSSREVGGIYIWVDEGASVPLTIGSSEDVANGHALTLGTGSVGFISVSPLSSMRSVVVPVDLVLKQEGYLDGYRMGDVSTGDPMLVVSGSVSDSGRGLGLTTRGSVALQAANTYSGATTVEGLLRLTGPDGSVRSSSKAVLTGSLRLDDTNGTNGDRIGDAARIEMHRGSELSIVGGAATHSSETVGQIILEGVPSTITLNPGSQGSATLVARGITRNNFATMLVRGTGLGSNAPTDASWLKLSDAPSLIGGGGGAGSTNMSIVPFMVGDTSPTGGGNALVTYDRGADGIAGTPDDRGLRPLDRATEYQTYSAAGATDNVHVSTSIAGVAGKAINALHIEPGRSLEGAGVLTIGSGAVLASSLPSIREPSWIAGFEAVDFGAREALFHINRTGSQYAWLEIDSPILGSGGLTKSGEGNLVITGECNYTGTTRILQGLLEVCKASALGSSGGDGVIISRGGEVLIHENMTITRPITLDQGVLSANGLKKNLIVTLSGPVNGSGTLSGSPLASFEVRGDATLSGSISGRSISFYGKTVLDGVVSGGGDVTLAGNTVIGARGLNLESFDALYVLSGNISGSGAIDVNSGTLVSPKTQSLTGPISIQSSSAKLGAEDALGTGSLKIAYGNVVNSDQAPHTFNNASIDFHDAVFGGAGSSSMTFTGSGDVWAKISVENDGAKPVVVTLSGNLHLRDFEKAGGGVLELMGNNLSLNGGVFISQGTLLVNNRTGSATGDGAVSVSSGATLGGAGRIAGTVTLADGAILAPGNSAGTLSTGSLVLSEGSVLAFDLSSPGSGSDSVDITGNLTLDGILNIAAGDLFGPGSYRLFSYSGNLVDHGLSLGLSPEGLTYRIDTATPHQVSLVVVPEPTGLLVWLPAAGLLLRRRQRH